MTSPVAPSKPVIPDSGLDSGLRSTPWGLAFWREFLSNSGHFLILKILADTALFGWQVFLTDPAEYMLIAAMLLQTLYLSRPHPSRFWGNLIGVSLYTLIDLPIDGGDFFQNPSHGVFWLFSLAIAVLQSIRYHWRPQWERWTLPLESVIRMLMVLVFYLVVSVGDQASQLAGWAWVKPFTAENTHLFLMASLVLVGLLLGMRQLQIVVQQRQLKQTATLLHNLAEWGMGSHAVTTAVNHPERLAFQQCDRAILFMDIRGFTHWSEHTDTETVAATLNRYYQQVEPAVSQHHPLRITFTGDEIMAIFSSPHQALAAAQAMQQAANSVLHPYHIGAGCAIHYGTVVEGLFGGESVRTYTVIGDVVNTAKRLESATPAGEITISNAVYQALHQRVAVQPAQNLRLKGKGEPLQVWRLA
jgi:adenylate cyclase